MKNKLKLKPIYLKDTLMTKEALSKISFEEVYEIKVHCKKCSVNETIDIPREIIDECMKPILVVHIPQNRICTHQFNIFLDKNLQIRGFEYFDYDVEPKKGKGSSSSDSTIVFS